MSCEVSVSKELQNKWATPLPPVYSVRRNRAYDEIQNYCNLRGTNKTDGYSAIFCSVWYTDKGLIFHSGKFNISGECWLIYENDEWGLTVLLIPPDVFQFAHAGDINCFVLPACFVLVAGGEPCLNTPAATAESLWIQDNPPCNPTTPFLCWWRHPKY